MWTLVARWVRRIVATPALFFVRTGRVSVFRVRCGVVLCLAGGVMGFARTQFQSGSRSPTERCDLPVAFQSCRMYRARSTPCSVQRSTCSVQCSVFSATSVAAVQIQHRPHSLRSAPRTSHRALGGTAPTHRIRSTTCRSASSSGLILHVPGSIGTGRFAQDTYPDCEPGDSCVLLERSRHPKTGVFRCDNARCVDPRTPVVRSTGTRRYLFVFAVHRSLHGSIRLLPVLIF